MLTYNPETDIMADVPVEAPCKLTWWQLNKMAQNCLWAEKMYIDLEMYDEARRYMAIWHRIMKAMLNPDKFFGK